MKLFKKYPLGFQTIVLIFILLIGFFFRIYQVVERFKFAHDGDLFSWIVKDIVVDHHIRLIGQLTSAEGIYIGPLFYYSLIPFFTLTNMDPIGGIILITILGMATLVSYYFVFSKLFNTKLALITTFLQAVLLSRVDFDRWVVPSTPTNLWVVWYFYTIVQIARGNFIVLPLLAVLIGLIWHIHIALMPALLVVPVAIILSKKIPSVKQVIVFLIVLSIVSLPLLIFEARHNFLQTQAFIDNFRIDHGGGRGFPKLNVVATKMGTVINNLFFYPQNLPLVDYRYLGLGLLLSSLVLMFKKVIRVKEIVLFFTWVAGVVLFYVSSTSLISEYYFYNIEIIFLVIVSFWFYFIFKSSRVGKWVILSVLTLILVKNASFFLIEYTYQKGYTERKEAAKYITEKAKSANFPCVAISYITAPGENVGFRYFFWMNNLHVNQPKDGGPVYTIVIPDELAKETPMQKFGHIGVYGPTNVDSEEKIKESCSGEDHNLTYPMLGFSGAN